VLDQDFEDPEEGIFSLNLVREALDLTRNRLRTGELKPDVGNLGELL
jgi:hypothetical protein